MPRIVTDPERKSLISEVMIPLEVLGRSIRQKPLRELNSDLQLNLLRALESLREFLLPGDESNWEEKPAVEKPVIRVPTSLGDAEARSEKPHWYGDSVWAISYPWGGNYFSGTEAEVTVYMNRVINLKERELREEAE